MQAKIDPPLPWRLTYVCQTHLFPPPQPKTYAGSSMSCTHCLAHTCTSGALGVASLLPFGPGGSLSSSAACFRARRVALDPGNQDVSTLRLRPTCFADEKQCVGGKGKGGHGSPWTTLLQNLTSGVTFKRRVPGISECSWFKTRISGLSSPFISCICPSQSFFPPDLRPSRAFIG